MARRATLWRPIVADPIARTGRVRTGVALALASAEAPDVGVATPWIVETTGERDHREVRRVLLRMFADGIVAMRPDGARDETVNPWAVDDAWRRHARQADGMLRNLAGEFVQLADIAKGVGGVTDIDGQRIAAQVVALHGIEPPEPVAKERAADAWGEWYTRVPASVGFAAEPWPLR